MPNWLSSFFGARRRPASAVPGRSRAENFFATRASSPEAWPGFSPQTGLDSGRRDRTLDGFLPQSIGPNRLHQQDAKLTLARARSLVENNPLATSAVEAYVSNVLQNGITPLPRLEDTETRKLWQRAWGKIWGARHADLAEDLSIDDLAALWLSEVIIAGGCLVHYTWRKVKGDRRVPLALELITEERFADDRDTLPIPQRQTKTQNPIVRGVELDAATNRAVAYWIWPADPLDIRQAAADPIRLPAEDCHYALAGPRRRVAQKRGISLLAPAITYLWKLGYYTDNELTGSAIANCFAVAIKTEADDDFPGIRGETGDDTSDDAGNRFENLQPGIVARLRPGESVETVNPNRSHADAAVWIKLIERSIAIAMHLSRQELTRDVGEAVFASMRAAFNMDRIRYRRMQKFSVENFHQPTYERFLKAATVAGLDGFPTAAELVSEWDDLSDCAWQCPGWASVNPKDDAQAAEIEIKIGTQSRAGVIQARGGNVEQVFDELAHEEQLADEREIEIHGDASGGATDGDMAEGADAPAGGQRAQ